MIVRYRLLAGRLRAELRTLEQIVARAEGALSRATQQVQNRDYFLAAAALDLHGFYSGLERLFELIAAEVDESAGRSALASRPVGSDVVGGNRCATRRTLARNPILPWWTTWSSAMLYATYIRSIYGQTGWPRLYRASTRPLT